MIWFSLATVASVLFVQLVWDCAPDAAATLFRTRPRINARRGARGWVITSRAHVSAPTPEGNMLRSAIASLVLLSSASAFAYQVTGEVKEVTDDGIVVMKGKEKFELKKNADTKGDAPKVGDKVTIEYFMTATKVEAKPAKGDKKADKKGDKKDNGDKK
jgi:hypothetical protein